MTVDGVLAVGPDVLWYADTESGLSPIVLLHAYAGSGRSFHQQLAAFSDAGHRVVTYSRRGHAGSTGPSELKTPAADDLRVLIDTLGLGRVHLVATAAGGFTATDFADSWPGDVTTLTLACTMIGIEDDDYQSLCAAHRPADFDRLTAEQRELSARYRAEQPSGVVAWRRNEPSRRIPLPVHRRPITWKTIERLGMPVHLICGALDPYAPPPVMRAVAERLPNARLSVIADTGHSAYWERPDEFNRLVLDFLSE